MSGGGRRGEVRKRSAAPCPKAAGGTHNRRARRAAKARGEARAASGLLGAAAEDHIAERYRRQRAQREAYWSSRTHDEILSMRLEESERDCNGLGGEWFLPLLLDAIPLWVARHAATPPEVRGARAHELGETIAYSQGAAAIADPDARASEKGGVAKVFNAIAEGLAIGAFCPDGSVFAGHHWQVDGNQLRITSRLSCEQVDLV